MRRTGMEREITDTELTAKGWGLCVSAAFFEEAAVLLGFGIEILEAPFLVLLFLWFLFTVLTGAALIAASNAAWDACTGNTEALQKERRVQCMEAILIRHQKRRWNFQRLLEVSAGIWYDGDSVKRK